MPHYHIRYGGDGMPDGGLSFGDRALDAMRRFQDETRPAQVDAHLGTAMSYRELLVQTVHLAEGWKTMGLTIGDVVAVVSKNNHQVFPLTLGAVCAGLSVTCLVPSSTEVEMRHAISLAQPKVVVSEACCLATAMAAAPDRQHIVLDGEAPQGVGTFLGLMREGATAEQPADIQTYRAVDVGDRTKHTPFILFSSGTTGLPKGVRLPDSSLCLIVENFR